MNKFVFVCLAFMLISACSDSPKKSAKQTPYPWPLIEGFPRPQVPADNPMTAEKVALGKVIFFDSNLSFNRQQSCASCHQQQYGFGENIAQSVGTTGEQHRRNAQALVNVAYNKTLTWAHDGITSIEQQILLPMFGEQPIELGITGHEQEVLARFKSEEYLPLFEAAFPAQTVSFPLIVKALASYVRSLISLNAPFDRYAYQGDDSALSDSAIRGMTLFFSEKFECHHCHGGFNFTQSTSHEKQLIDRRPFHNTGLYFVERTQSYPIKDRGLAEISTLERDDGRFRAPTLRNVEVTAPYMHDGSIATLSEVIDFYAAGGRNIEQGEFKGNGQLHPLKSPFVKGIEMSEQDKADLLAFLKSLTDQQFLTDPALVSSNKE